MKKKYIILFSIIFVVIAICLTSLYIKNQTYIKAEEYLKEKNYDEAIKYYERNKTYKDSSEKIKECEYLKANYLFEIGNYEDAYKAWSLMQNYKESEKLALKAKYELAKQYEEMGNYKEAYLKCIELNNYEDAKKLSENYFKKMIEESKVGDTIYYGKYEQDGNNENGEELIEWIVLGKKDNDILLISNNILEKMRFGTSYYWEKSEIREWLNNKFYNNAFTENEKSNIQKMITSNNTEDKVFCLSAEEVRILFSSDWYRIAYPTQKLLKEGFKVWSDSLESGEWWTRSISTARNGKGVVPVEGDGNVRSAGTNELAPEEYTYTDIGARPTICINLSMTQENAKNMDIFGHNSNTGLDNEPDIRKSNSGSGTNSTTSTTGSCPKSGQYAGLWGDANIGKCPLCGKQCGVTRTSERKQVETWNHTKVYKEVCVYNVH